jgi:hypothetical protein
MSNVPDARDPQNSERRNRERWIPLSTIYYLAIASGIGTSAHYLPDLAGPVSLGLATFLTLDRVTRQIR